MPRRLWWCWVIATAGPAATRAGVALHLDFITEAERRPLFTDSLRYQDAAGEALSFTRIAWLATGVSLTTAGGDELVFPDAVAFVTDRDTILTLPGLPEERITAVTFHVGPDEKQNHADPAGFPAGHPLNPEVDRLHWDWQGGYIFLALEGHWRAPGQGTAMGGYAYHFARDPNRVTVTLPVDLDLRYESRVAIAFDPEKLLAGFSFTKDGTTTHSREGDPVSERLKAALPGAFRIAGVQRGGVPQPEAAPKPIDLPAKPTPFPLRLPRTFPLPALPADNPLIVERVTLGEKLFHDPALSRTGKISCASCHQEAHVFSDPRRFSPGVDGKHGDRHSMPLFNLAWKSSYFWDGRAPSLRAQALVPLQDHLEMDSTPGDAAARLAAKADYPALFARAFGSGAITAETIGLAIENFLLTRISFDARFDRVMAGRESFTKEEARGFELFFTESEPRTGQRGADCFHCHGGVFFTDHLFHNNGLAPTDDTGREKITGLATDRDKFATPSLRNVALTAPYMHDGRFATLEDVIAHYDHGFTLGDTVDPNIAKHPQGLGLGADDQKALVAFLRTLTGSAEAAAAAENSAADGAR